MTTSIQRRHVFVTTNTWNVSFETPHRAGDGTVGARLNVFFIDHDEPNDLGGKGVVHYHPTFNGLVFSDVDEASWFAYEHGLLWVWAWSHNPSDRLPEPLAIAPTPSREVAR